MKEKIGEGVDNIALLCYTITIVRRGAAEGVNMTLEKQFRIMELKSEINSAVLEATMAAQNTGRHTSTGSVKEFMEAASAERKATNKVADLVDELAKEAFNENN